jgi:hypothetical protein
MIEGLAIYSLSLFFAFYVLNHSYVISDWVTSLLSEAPDWLSYLFQCPFCVTFWWTLWVAAFHLVPWFYVPTAPVVVLFLNLAYRSLYTYAR